MLRKPYDTRPRTQVSKRQQGRRKTFKKTTKGATQSQKTRNGGQQKTNRSCPKWPTYRQIWVLKTLLKAQGESTFKWVPKQLLHQATIPDKQSTTQKQWTTKKSWPKKQITKKWIPTDVLTKQGYSNDARYIWIPKNKKGQKIPKLQETSLAKSPAIGQTKLKWMPKGQQAKQPTRTKTEVPRKQNKTAKIEKKATALGKEKWVPKVACKTTENHNEQLPSTTGKNTANKTTNTTATQSSNQPISGTTPLDVVKQLVFILRTFNSKQVNTTWRQFMASRLQIENPCQQKPLD